MHTDLNALIEVAGDLATLPSTILRLLAVLRDPAVSAHEVRAILEPDPAMTTNLLKLANSAYYGHRRRIRTVQEALVLLGNRATVTLAFASSMTPILRRELRPYCLDRETFWRHSLLAAHGAAGVVQAERRRDLAGVAYTAGLIHDAGKLLIATQRRQDGRPLAEGVLAAGGRAREQELLGFDHAEAGAALAEHWGLPAALSVPLRHHHEPGAADEEADIVRAVAAGDLLAHAAADSVRAAGAECPAAGRRQERLAELGLDTEIVERLLAKLVAATGAVPVPDIA